MTAPSAGVPGSGLLPYRNHSDLSSSRTLKCVSAPPSNSRSFLACAWRTRVIAPLASMRDGSQKARARCAASRFSPPEVSGSSEKSPSKVSPRAKLAAMVSGLNALARKARTSARLPV